MSWAAGLRVQADACKRLAGDARQYWVAESLAELAQDFLARAARMEAAWNGGKPAPLPALQRMGAAYLAFARDEPAYFSAMFECGLPPGYSRELQEAGDRAIAPLRIACEAVAATLPPDKRPPAMMMALHIWTQSHGIASLFGRGDRARRPLPMAPEELLEAATLIYLDGLGLHRGKA